MGVLVVAVIALVGYRLWIRLREIGQTVERLAHRVAELEATTSITTAAVAVTSPEQPSPTPAPTAALEHPPLLEPAAGATPMTSAVAPDALESRIGSRWLLYVGVAAIVIGVSYFEKLAIENQWVNETWRTIQGGLAGVVLVGAGLRIARRGYQAYGQILTGAGVAVMYVSAYAACNFYQLISQPVAFGLMSTITMVAAWLADSGRSHGLAVVAVAGGFVTPFLLPSPTDHETALFGYDTILVSGTILLSHRRRWPALNLVSYVFTTLTILSWAAVFYTSSKYLTTEFFLTIFCALFLVALRGMRSLTNPAARFQSLVLWTAPVGYYALSIANLFEHSSALLIFLVVLSLVGVIAGSRTNSWVRLVFLCATDVPLLAWSVVHAGQPWLAAGLTAWSAIYVLNLAGLLEATLAEPPRLAPPDIALLHLTALAAYLGAFVLIEPVRLAACAPLAAGLATLHLGFAALIRTRQREEALHFVALGATFVTIAIALQFDGPWVTNGWAAEAFVVAWLGLREHRSWLRRAGLVLFAVAVGRLLTLQFGPSFVGELVFINRRAISGMFVIALAYGLAHLHRGQDTGHEYTVPITTLRLAANALTLTLLTSEINAYWHAFEAQPLPDSTSLNRHFARELMLSVVWAAYATALVVVGLIRRYSPIRYLAIAVFALTITKVFAFDLAELDRIYRVLSIIGLGAALLLTSYLYQRLNQETL